MITAIVFLSILAIALLIVIVVLIYLYRGQSRTTRNQSDYIRELLMVRNANIHRVPVERTLTQAINDALQPMGTVDFNEMFKDYERKPYVSRESRAK